MVDTQINHLGKPVNYTANYDPKLLFRIERQAAKNYMNSHFPKIIGADIWNCYEISWLNLQGQPQQMLGRFTYSANSPYIVESKSLKLYLNSYNQTKFTHYSNVTKQIAADLSEILESEVDVALYPLDKPEAFHLSTPPGFCLDNISVDFDFTRNPDVTPDFLQLSREEKADIFHNSSIIDEVVYSHALRSNCPVTNQPDWGSLLIYYQGAPIDKANLLRYIISYRQHQGFHEECVERIFYDLSTRCKPHKLIVQAFYTRRGGIDICPWRSSCPELQDKLINPRLVRQ